MNGIQALQPDLFFTVSFVVVRDLSAYPDIRVLDNSYVIPSVDQTDCVHEGVRDSAKIPASIYFGTEWCLLFIKADYYFQHKMQKIFLF